MNNKRKTKLKINLLEKIILGSLSYGKRSKSTRIFVENISNINEVVIVRFLSATVFREDLRRPN